MTILIVEDNPLMIPCPVCGKVAAWAELVKYLACYACWRKVEELRQGGKG